ncbi:hypothetical protein, partial [Staphylococcus capitis]|uniref:hypothetical protein n=1 Tax=Staphylococcus capitis TaxID=29388 RepID=UPI003CFE425C
GACTSLALLGTLATHLANAGIATERAVVVDPQVVTAESSAAVVAGLAANLGLVEEESQSRSRAIAAEPDLRRAVATARRLLGEAMATFVEETTSPGDDEAALLLEEVLPRYVAWAAFQLGAARHRRHPALAGIDVFAGQEHLGLPAVLGPRCRVTFHRHSTPGRPALTHDGIGPALRSVLGEAGWPA